MKNAVKNESENDVKNVVKNCVENCAEKKTTISLKEYNIKKIGAVFNAIFHLLWEVRFRIDFSIPFSIPFSYPCSYPFGKRVCKPLAPSLAHPECGTKKWPNSTLPNFGSTLPIFWPNFGSTLRVPFRILGRLHVVRRIDMAYEILIISLWMSGLGKARPRIVNRGQLRSHMACLAMGL